MSDFSFLVSFFFSILSIEMKSDPIYLLETIKIENRELVNLDYHRDRIRRSSNSLYGIKVEIDFSQMQEAANKLCTDKHKLRVVYNNDFLKYTIEPYQLKPIKSLRLIDGSKISYTHKLLDRIHLKRLYELKSNADDILIVKDGMLTDTFYCNVALYSEPHGGWKTPQLPLLKGTKRQQLLNEGLIEEELIYSKDLAQYSQIRLFNAMVEFGEVELSVGEIN